MAPGAWISLITLLAEYFVCLSGSLVENNASEIDWNSMSKPPVNYSNVTSERLGQLPPDDLLTNNSSSHETEHHGIHVANWRWDEIGVFFTLSVFIVVSGLAKVGKLV
jgi:hypothetical protein